MLAAASDEASIQSLRHLRRRRLNVAGTTSLPAVAEKRELRDDEQLSSRFESRSVHLIVLVGKNAQVNHFFGKTGGVAFRVVAADAEKGRRSALDAVHDFHGEPNDRLLVLYVAAVIARADHELLASEEAALADICEALDLPAQESLARIWGIAGSEASSA